MSTPLRPSRGTWSSGSVDEGVRGDRRHLAPAGRRRRVGARRAASNRDDARDRVRRQPGHCARSAQTARRTEPHSHLEGSDGRQLRDAAERRSPSASLRSGSACSPTPRTCRSTSCSRRACCPKYLRRLAARRLREQDPTVSAPRFRGTRSSRDAGAVCPQRWFHFGRARGPGNVLPRSRRSPLRRPSDEAGPFDSGVPLHDQRASPPSSRNRGGHFLKRHDERCTCT
jgi:hypothetical protein